MQTTNQTPPVAELPVVATLSASALCILFGGNTVAIKISLSGLGIFTVAAIRFGLAAVVIAFWAWFTRQPMRLGPQEWKEGASISIFEAEIFGEKHGN